LTQSKLKPLSNYQRAEIEAKFADKPWAYAAVTGRVYDWRLGIAAANEQGYSPVPEHWCNAAGYDLLHDYVDELNRGRGLDVDEATRIVASTMGGRPYQPLGKR
jgi:hypothetical protein